MRCAPRASNGPNHLGSCGLQAGAKLVFNLKTTERYATMDCGPNTMALITSECG